MKPLRPALLVCGAAGVLALALACGKSETTPPAPTAVSTPPPAAPFDQPVGEALVARLGCLSCHEADAAAQARIQPLAAPPLAGIGQHLAPGWLRFWLDDPQAPEAESRMPDLLHALQPDARRETVEDLTHYLASLDGPFEPQATRPDDWRVEEGGALFQRLGCFACHADGALEARQLAAKTDLLRAAAFLRDPLSFRPGCGMPDLGLSASEALAIASWLLREQYVSGPLREDLVPGVRYAYVELAADAPDPSKLADIRDWTPTRTGLTDRVGLLPGHSQDRFAYRFEGWLTLGEPATLRFGLNSDDGSDLTVDGAMVVDNDGLHAPVEKRGSVTLAAGRHQLVVRMYENAGGEVLEAWMERAGGEREALGAANLSVIGAVYAPVGNAPLAVDPARAARGARRFAELGCARCHGDPGGLPGDAVARAAPAFATLRPEAGCLAEAPPAAAARYALSAEERAALRAVVAHARELAQPLAPDAAVVHALTRLNCIACHERAGAGGPSAATRARFTGEGDVGDEGRIPPSLNGVGGKLRPEWLERVLAGKGAVRGFYLHARMPRFAPEQLAGLAGAFRAADLRARSQAPAAFAPELVAAGRALGGAGGLNCIQCHRVAGHAAQGMQVMDLTQMNERLEPAWFQAWLRNPLAMRAGTRMPVYFSGERSSATGILNGDATRQIDALWAWLALGGSLPLPPGLEIERAAFELVPVDRPLYLGAFMLGGSARVVNVGFPERVHASFDLHNARLMQVWRGDFFDAEGTWNGRAGQLQQPAGEAVRALPPGPAFARLPAPDAPWPLAAGKHAGWRMRGERRDAEGRPTFRYHFAGFEVEESLLPRYAEGGALLIRRFRVTVPAGESGWTFRAADGPGLRVNFTGDAQAVARGAETLVPLAPGIHEFEVVMAWE